MESFSPYLAGFFDGDGSLHFQIVRQKEYRYGFYIRSSFVLYQATSAEAGLREIGERLEAGRMRRRAGGMSDLTITNREDIRLILTRIRPHVIFKRLQVERGLALLDRLPPPKNRQGFLQICEAVDDFASLNFSKARTVTAEAVRSTWRSMGVVVPVTTDPNGETVVTADTANLRPP